MTGCEEAMATSAVCAAGGEKEREEERSRR